MLEFIKNIFLKKGIPEVRVALDGLNTWLNEKAKPISDNLKNEIEKLIGSIKHEKSTIVENLKILEEAKLQNPKIPERALTIMEGNRVAFIKKVSFFFDNIELGYDDYNELIEKCKNIKDGIETLGKGTARSFQVLNEFFAREVENVASNIKHIENHSKAIMDAINNSKIMDVDNIKIKIDEINNKIKLKNIYTIKLDNDHKNLEDLKNKESEIEKRIEDIRSSSDYKDYENLLLIYEKTKSKLTQIENGLYHEFSVLEKSLKKYAKIAFENEKLILEYLGDSIITLLKDEDFKILKILDDLKNAISRNEFELEDRKKSKTLEKIEELDHVYFMKVKDDYAAVMKKLNEIKIEIKNNRSTKELDTSNQNLKEINDNIRDVELKISNIKNDIEKIDIEKLKYDLVNNVQKIVDVKITLV